MKKGVKFFKFIFSLALILMLAIFPSANLLNQIVFAQTNQISESDNEQDENQDENFYSVFIHKPTFSILYNEKIYFIDEHDSYLKIYDTNSQKFSSNYLKLNELGVEKIVDATFTDHLFILLSQNDLDDTSTLTIISLDEFKIIGSVNDNLMTAEYSRVSARLIDSKKEIAITLTRNNNTIFPLIVFCDISETVIETDNNEGTQPDESKNPEDSEITQDEETMPETPPVKTISETISQSIVYSINLTDTEIRSLSKMLILDSSESADRYYLIFIYGKTVSYTTMTKSDIAGGTISSISSLVSSNNLDEGIINANIMEIENKKYLLVTYSNDKYQETNEIYSTLYELNVYNLGTDNIIDTKVNFPNADNPYILTNNDYAIYSDQESQKIVYVKVDPNQSQSIAEYEALNPEIHLEYKQEDEFIYQTTTSETEILSRPWSAKSLSIIPTGTDVIYIGNGYIEGLSRSNMLVEDYHYCLYTFGGQNYLGYVKASNLVPKSKISIDDYPYPIFKVVPETPLYSAPTAVTGDKITESLNSEIIEKIRDNSRIEIQDVICGYSTKFSTTNEVWVKVKVNNNNIGYIESSKIISPSDRVKFVVTNSSLKGAKTNVYIDPDANSTIIYQLDKGYRVRVNGNRNTTTGFTNITFNDEYGNEFTGYIQTDYIVTDSWSTLQIIGLVLIAINIGLLILIIYFKRKKIGNDGEKYNNSKKENYNISNDEDFENLDEDSLNSIENEKSS